LIKHAIREHRREEVRGVLNAFTARRDPSEGFAHDPLLRHSTRRHDFNQAPALSDRPVLYGETFPLKREQRPDTLGDEMEGRTYAI